MKIKVVRRGSEHTGHVLKDTTSHGLYERVWSPYTSDRRGGGKVVSKEVGEEERGARGGVDRRSDTAVDVEVDPHRRRLQVGRSQTDFALEAIVECHTAKAK
jgi:hypothetical protein